ncbi:MAG: DUF3021 domain-containing protein [Lachnospiraceae bacterium]|nr:DUF3021 domain-containing protein [Lachnospiraceae bacterium]
MKLRDKFIINSLIGFVIGMIVGVIIWIFLAGDSEPDHSLLMHVIMSGLHGLIPVGAATVFEIESWGLTKQTVVHALLTLASILGIDIPMNWWKPGAELAIALVCYVVAYTIIWLVNYFYWKITVRKMNEELQQLHEHEKDQDTKPNGES